MACEILREVDGSSATRDPTIVPNGNRCAGERVEGAVVAASRHVRSAKRGPLDRVSASLPTTELPKSTCLRFALDAPTRDVHSEKPAQSPEQTAGDVLRGSDRAAIIRATPPGSMGRKTLCAPDSAVARGSAPSFRSNHATSCESDAPPTPLRVLACSRFRDRNGPFHRSAQRGRTSARSGRGPATQPPELARKPRRKSRVDMQPNLRAHGLLSAVQRPGHPVNLKTMPDGNACVLTSS